MGMPMFARLLVAFMVVATCRSPLGAQPGVAFAPPEVAMDAQEKLRAERVRFRPWPVTPVKLGNKALCEVPQGVAITRGATGLRYARPARVNGAFALRLVRFEKLMQEEAMAAFGRPVARIEHLGTYACRTMAAYPDWVSEHAFANAIDVAGFVLKGGRRVTVDKDWIRKDQEATTAQARFLRRLARRLYDEDVFSVVLTPSFDRRHQNHFHLDGASYRVDGT